MKRIRLQYVLLFAIMIASAMIVQNKYTSTYVAKLKSQTMAVAKMQTGDLYEQLEEKAKEYYRKPQNAVVDRVWKAIPGYNGLELDVEASFKKMKQLKLKKIDEKELEFKQIKPKVSLDDLPPSPIYKGNPQKPMVTLLVNVSWGEKYLPTLLKVMKKHGVHSTYFLDGTWVKKNPSLAKMIVDEGHEIGNHAYSHPDLKRLTKARITDELESTNHIIQATLNKKPKWFAPPSGSFRDDVVKIAAQMNMKTILWSVDTIDWREPDPTTMVNSVLSKVHPGAMILMHPTNATAKGLDSLIKGLKKNGYQIGTVSELMDEKRILSNKVNHLK